MIWNRSDIRRARQTALAPVLQRLGDPLQSLPDENYRLAGRSGDIVVKRHYWVCTQTGAAGNAIDFLVQVKGMTFNDAVRLLLS